MIDSDRKINLEWTEKFLFGQKLMLGCKRNIKQLLDNTNMMDIVRRIQEVIVQDFVS